VIELIRFYEVTKVYPSGATALLSVNTFINKGEFVFLVGSSGAGKTTFLKLLTREIVPTRGQVPLREPKSR
jgi:cell division transport system ATP-binding protein